MAYVHRVLRVQGKSAEVLQRELDEAGQEDFHVVAVTGAADRTAEMIVLEKRVKGEAKPPQGEAGWAVNRGLQRPAAAVVRSRLDHYDD